MQLKFDLNICYQSPNTELVAEQNDTLLVFFTLEGSFVGVSQQTGEIRWKHHDGICFV